MADGESILLELNSQEEARFWAKVQLSRIACGYQVA